MAQGIEGRTRVVFVTAYDEFAVHAFEHEAVDYVLKPVQAARLQKTVQKVQLALASRAQIAMDFEATLAQLRGLLAAGQPAPAGLAPLPMLQASVGNSIRMVPVDELLCLEAADKYVRVLNLTGHEFLIRTPLKDLLPQLDARQFWQIHRGCVVRASHIEFVTRDEAGKLWLQLRGLGPKLAVSRLYAHLFRAM